MKRFIISLALIFLSFFACFATSNAVEKHADRLQLQLTEAAEFMESENTEKTEEQLKKVTATWNKTEQLFSFIVDADKIEQLSADIPLLLVHINDGNKDYAMAKLRECERLLEEIAENEKLNVKNVM